MIQENIEFNDSLSAISVISAGGINYSVIDKGSRSAVSILLNNDYDLQAQVQSTRSSSDAIDTKVDNVNKKLYSITKVDQLLVSESDLQSLLQVNLVWRDNLNSDKSYTAFSTDALKQDPEEPLYRNKEATEYHTDKLLQPRWLDSELSKVPYNPKDFPDGLAPEVLDRLAIEEPKKILETVKKDSETTLFSEASVELMPSLITLSTDFDNYEYVYEKDNNDRSILCSGDKSPTKTAFKDVNDNYYTQCYLAKKKYTTYYENCYQYYSNCLFYADCYQYYSNCYAVEFNNE